MKTRTRITEWRAEPTVTERTLAALVGGVKTRVHVAKEADNPTINGLYAPTEDQIILYKCKGGIPAVAVALEEAGHSLERDTYLRLATRAKEVGEKLERWDPQAPGLIDWYEDGRIYEKLKAEYPGSVDDLDYVWDLREGSLDKLAWDTTGMSALECEMVARRKMLAEEFANSVSRYKAGNSFKTFDEVLDHLDKFTANKPQDREIIEKGGMYIIGMKGKQPAGQGLKMLKPGENLPIAQMTVVMVFDTAGGFGETVRDYDWPVLRTDYLNVEDSSW